MSDSPISSISSLCAIIACTLLVPIWQGTAGAETAVIVEPGSNGDFLVSAGNMNGIRNGEIRLDYMTDAPAAAPGVVVLGNNTKATLRSSGVNFGTVVISILGRIPANGYVYLARINVSDLEGNQGRIIPPYYARFTRDKGEQETASVNVRNPSPADKRTDDLAKRAEDQKKVIAEAVLKRQQEPPARPAAVSADDTPVKVQDPSEQRDSSRDTVVLVASTSSPSAAPPAKAISPTYRRVDGVLDRFRNHSGEWTPDVIERLSVPIDSHEFRQEPAVLIADGVAGLQVGVRSAIIGDAINCFAVRGGQVASVQQGEEGEWLLTVIPRLGALEVTIAVRTVQHIIEYPLTVAPPLELFDATNASHGLSEFVKAINEKAGVVARAR